MEEQKRKEYNEYMRKYNKKYKKLPHVKKKINAYKRDYSKRDYVKKKNNLYQKEYVKQPQVRQRINAHLRQRRKMNPAFDRDKQQRYKENLRKQVIEFLGGKCCKCGYSDWRALQVDHINGGGTQLNKQVSWSKRYRLILSGGSTEIQLLCANCNWIKRHENKELLRVQ